MWRFIVVTFAFLGWSFYVLSGGSDYAPGENSFQARTIEGDAKPAEVQVVELEQDSQSAAATTTSEPVVTRSISGLSDIETDDGTRFQITLASVSATNDYAETANAEASAIDAVLEELKSEESQAAEADLPESVQTGFVGEEVFSLETYVMRQDSSYTPTTSEDSYVESYDGDIRQVSGNLVNMRAGPGTDYQKVAKLSKGTRIAVLEEPGNGWVMLEVLDTGETGWMADWLVTAAN